jgi:hypothetical protein
VPDPTAIWQQTNAALSKFLSLELDIGLAFAQAADKAASTRDLLRSRRSARKAYDTACSMMRKTKLTESDARRLAQRLEQLRLALRRLGDPGVPYDGDRYAPDGTSSSL